MSSDLGKHFYTLYICFDQAWCWRWRSCSRELPYNPDCNTQRLGNKRRLLDVSPSFCAAEGPQPTVVLLYLGALIRVNEKPLRIRVHVSGTVKLYTSAVCDSQRLMCFYERFYSVTQLHHHGIKGPGLSTPARHLNRSVGWGSGGVLGAKQRARFLILKSGEVWEQPPHPTTTTTTTTTTLYVILTCKSPLCHTRCVHSTFL